MSELSSKPGFKPIQFVEFVCRTVYHAEPWPLYRLVGVDLRPFDKNEMQDYVDAGNKEACGRVRAEILDRRGGVLPANWEVVEIFKENMDLIEHMRLRNSDSDGD